MIKNKLYKKLRGITAFCTASLFFFFVFTSSLAAQTNPNTSNDSVPPPPPPPPPPVPDNYTGPGSTLSAATLKKIETFKSILSRQLSTISLNGNREHDYLVKVMQLNYAAINNLVDAELGIAATNTELTKQADLFLEANALLPPDTMVDSASGAITLKNSMQKPGLSNIKDELVQISEEYKRSGMDPKLLSFADKILGQSGKKNEEKN